MFRYNDVSKMLRVPIIAIIDRSCQPYECWGFSWVMCCRGWDFETQRDRYPQTIPNAPAPDGWAALSAGWIAIPEANLTWWSMRWFHSWFLRSHGSEPSKHNSCGCQKRKVLIIASGCQKGTTSTTPDRGSVCQKGRTVLHKIFQLQTKATAHPW